MAILSILGTAEYYANVTPAYILIETNDSLADVMATGYLNSEVSITWDNSQLALVTTTEGTVHLSVSIVGGDTSLINPLEVATNTNSDAAAGNIGEYFSDQVDTGSAVSLTSTVSADITSLSLEAGNWIVYGNAGATASVSTVAFNTWLSLTSATMPDASLIASLSGLSGTFSGLATPALRLSLATTTTVYLSVNCTFTGTAGAYGQIQAIRPR